MKERNAMAQDESRIVDESDLDFLYELGAELQLTNMYSNVL